jgi:hypothetical protein
VHDRLNAAQGESKTVVIADSSFDQFKAAREFAMSGGQVIVDGDLMASLGQCPDRVAAYVSRSAGYEYFHSQSAFEAASVDGLFGLPLITGDGFAAQLFVPRSIAVPSS